MEVPASGSGLSARRMVKPIVSLSTLSAEQVRFSMLSQRAHTLHASIQTALNAFPIGKPLCEREQVPIRVYPDFSN